LANQKQGTAVKSYLLHSSLAGVQLCCAFYGLSKLRGHIQEQNHFPAPFTSLSKLRSCAGEKLFSGAKPACFSFASFDFKVQGPHTEHRWGCFPPTSTPSSFFSSYLKAHFVCHVEISQNMVPFIADLVLLESFFMSRGASRWFCNVYTYGAIIT
jgi:hypothetical protein